MLTCSFLRWVGQGSKIGFPDQKAARGRARIPAQLVGVESSHKSQSGRDPHTQNKGKAGEISYLAETKQHSFIHLFIHPFIHSSIHPFLLSSCFYDEVFRGQGASWAAGPLLPSLLVVSGWTDHHCFTSAYPGPGREEKWPRLHKVTMECQEPRLWTWIFVLLGLSFLIWKMGIVICLLEHCGWEEEQALCQWLVRFHSVP